MNADQQRALLTIALYAGFADGHKADSEREAIRRMAESLSDAQGAHPLASLYQDVLLQRVSLADAVRQLTDPAHAQLAYEMAVCVCDADGSQSEVERRFLHDLRRQLGLQDGAVQAFEAQADALAAYTSAASVAPAPAVAAAPAPRGRAVCPVGRTSGCRRSRCGCRPGRRRDRSGHPRACARCGVGAAPGSVCACGPGHHHSRPRRGGAGQKHPELRHPERRAGAAAAVLGLDGHHSAANQDGLWHWQGARRRAGHRPHQGVHCRCGCGPDLAVHRAVWPQAAGRPDGQGAGQNHGQGGGRGHGHGVFVCHHLRAGAAGQALLRGRAAHEHRCAALHLPGPAGPGARHADAVPAANPAKGQHAGCGPDHGAGQRPGALAQKRPGTAVAGQPAMVSALAR